MLVDFDRGAVQHQRCFVHQILLNQGCEDIFPYSSFCPGTEPAVHTLPWPEPLRQIPPWYSGVQPFVIDENGMIEKVMPKVKPDTNAAEILDYLRKNG